MNYNQALDYLLSLESLGSKLGLERMAYLMEKLDNPQEKIKIIHVAGTNGKGSTCSMLSNILICQGYKVGVSTSPHLESYNERFTINNIEISNEDFGTFMEKTKKVCDEIKIETGEQPTIFEVLTALSFLYYHENEVDYLILEVGLGGRMDATNVIKHPIISVITSISKDHVDFLGDNIEKIAFEKAGIIKENSPVVLYSQGENIYNVIKEIANSKNSELYYCQNNNIEIVEKTEKLTIFNVNNEYFNYEKIHLNLIGDYQIKNSITALLACCALKNLGIEISNNSIFEGLKNATWQGRMDIVSVNPTIILDGAHNVDGIFMLSESLKSYFKNRKITLLIGILGDKEYEKMIDLLLPLANKIVLTEPNNSRKWNVEIVKNYIEKNKNIEGYWEKDVEKALSLAKEITFEEDVICCAGSLYLIGEIYKLIKGGVI